MAIPTTQFRLLHTSTPTTAVDTAAERLAAVSSESTVSTGAGNEVDFGTLNISNGAQNSAIKTVMWNVTDSGAGNTQVSDFKVWLSSEGFDIADGSAKTLVTPFATITASGAAATFYCNSGDAPNSGDLVEFTDWG